MRGSMRGFTLIELLVVIAIIAILAAILFPVFAKAKAASYKAGCVSNLHQLGLAFTQYASDNDGKFPDAINPTNYWPNNWLNAIRCYGVTEKVNHCRAVPEFTVGGNKNSHSDGMGDYGMNYWASGKDMSRVVRPDRLFILGDATTSVVAYSYSATDCGSDFLNGIKGAYRSDVAPPICIKGFHNPIDGRNPDGNLCGFANVLFGDGHVEYIAADMCATATPGLMWNGTHNDPDALPSMYNWFQ